VPDPQTLQMVAARLLVLSAIVLVIGATEHWSPVAAGSLLLAAALWYSGRSVVLLAVAGLTLLCAAFDVRSILPQLDESRQGLSAVALLAATLHSGAAVLAGLALVRQSATHRATRRYARSVHREQDWMTGSHQILGKEDQQRDRQERAEQRRPIGHNGHQVTRVPEDRHPPLPHS
jgi:hypothetical protein